MQPTDTPQPRVRTAGDAAKDVGVAFVIYLVGAFVVTLLMMITMGHSGHSLAPLGILVLIWIGGLACVLGYAGYAIDRTGSPRGGPPGGQAASSKPHSNLRTLIIAAIVFSPSIACIVTIIYALINWM